MELIINPNKYDVFEEWFKRSDYYDFDRGVIFFDAWEAGRKYEKNMRRTPTERECCSETFYLRIGNIIVFDNHLWAIVRCDGCGNIRKRNIGSLKEIEEIK